MSNDQRAIHLDVDRNANFLNLTIVTVITVVMAALWVFNWCTVSDGVWPIP
jgi:hypothetical protein